MQNVTSAEASSHPVASPANVPQPHPDGQQEISEQAKVQGQVKEDSSERFIIQDAATIQQATGATPLPNALFVFTGATPVEVPGVSKSRLLNQFRSP